jgi:hypothetical protein
MSHDAEEVLRDKQNNNNFYIQDDKSTNFTNYSYAVAFVTFLSDGEIQEKFFCCKEPSETSKAQDIFNVLTSYLGTKVLPWYKCVGICTDGSTSTASSV